MQFLRTYDTHLTHNPNHSDIPQFFKELYGKWQKKGKKKRGIKSGKDS